MSSAAPLPFRLTERVAPPPLDPTAVHVWAAPLDLAPAALTRLEECLSTTERHRAARLALDRPRRRFIAARGTLRHLLAAYVGRSPSALRFRYGPEGKPVLERAPEDRRRLGFNLAHTSDLALLAVLLDREVGVDVERLGRFPRALDIARRFFSPEEAAALEALPPAERDRAFVRSWTLKEAALKAVGGGLFRDLRRLAAPLDPGGSTAPWRLRSLEPAAGYLGAIALPAGVSRILAFRLRRSWLSRLPATGA